MKTKSWEMLLKNADGILLTSPHNLRYFTGFCGGEGIALLKQGEAYLFVDSRYTEAAQKETTDVSVITFSAGQRNQEIQDRLSGVKTLAYEEDALSVAEYQSFCIAFGSLDWVGVSAELDLLRSVKQDWEIQRLAKAEEIGVAAYLAVLPKIKPGMTETQLAAELEYEMRCRGAEGTSFDTIAISGKKTSMPHGRPDEKKLEVGDFITMDFGCRYQGYCSDMTRTVVLGKASTEQKKIYDTVLSAQLAGLEAIAEGVVCCHGDKAARDVIAKAGYGDYFGHSLGHGVGLLIHEQPNLSPRSQTVLKAGMVVTCEPGIYIPDFGGVRIEDMVCVRQGGIQNLTTAEKRLIEL